MAAPGGKRPRSPLRRPEGWLGPPCWRAGKAAHGPLKPPSAGAIACGNSEGLTVVHLKLPCRSGKRDWTEIPSAVHRARRRLTRFH